MAVVDLFPTKVLIKDTELTNQQLSEMEIAIQAVFASHQAQTGSHIESGEETIPLFTPENIEIFPVLQTLKDTFIDGYIELGLANSDKQEVTDDIRQKVEELVDNHAGRIPLMRSGEYKQVHCHPGAFAFAVFYLTDVDNERDGGYLVLRDPSFNTAAMFTGEKKHLVETKAGRLIVGPAHLWHEVTPYHGDEDRVTVVSNLNIIQEEYADIF